MSGSNDRWSQIDTVCAAALQLPEAEREVFLVRACEDPALRREVQTLLAHASAAEHFLDTPVDALAAEILTGTPETLTGTRVGIFDVGPMLGAGGMGEVYRARDTRLARDVALKILPLTFALNPERLDRFRREAQALAALNHPNVGAIYGFEEAPGVYALILEFVDGTTLADRLDRQGPIPITEALDIARQVAQALEYAHEQGIVHNDLTPANITLRPDGTVKVLDFGLATAAASSPTRTSFGTPGYASPEQMRGAGDKRSDIWAFGVVLFEMLAGGRAFDDDPKTELSATVDWKALPAATPSPVRQLLQRCLTPDVKRRLRDIGEARIVLEDPHTVETPAASPAEPLRDNSIRRSAWRAVLALAGTALVIAAIVTALWLRQPAREVVRLSVTLPADQSLSTGDRSVAAISPDGTRLAYVAAPAGLYVRRLSAADSAPIAGLEGNGNLGEPVFSPDGQSILFHAGADQTLKRVPIGGGPAVTLCRALIPYGVSWSDEGIVFVEAGLGIVRVNPQGGEPTLVVALGADRAAQSPQLLPGGDHLLYTLAKGSGPNRWDTARVIVRTLSTGDERTVFTGGSDARYVPTGHLVYAVGGNLFVVPFDVRRLQVTGAPSSAIQGVRRGAPALTGTAQFSVAQNGTLIYVPGIPSANVDIGLVDRKGIVERLPLPSGSYEAPRVSPDGTRIAFGTDDGKEAAVWIYELDGKTAPKRLTFGASARFPVWSRDGRRVAYQSDRDGVRAIAWQPIDGGPATQLTSPGPGESDEPEVWSPTRDVLVFSRQTGPAFTLWTLSLESQAASRFGDVQSSTRTGAVFSPDGRWLAYASSNDAGKTIYVEPFPATGAKYQLTVADGGQPNHPQWSADGGELFYNPGPGRFDAVAVTMTSSVGFGKPVALPRFFPGASTQTRRPFDLLPDGRFVSPINPNASSSVRAGQEIRVVLNWFSELGTIDN